MRLAIIGATGNVGGELLKVLEAEVFFARPRALYLAGSTQYGNRALNCFGQAHPIETPEGLLAHKPQIAIFSAGVDVARHWGPRFTDSGCWVIDNSSAWRMAPDCPLIVPEVNGALLTKLKCQAPRIISNPNCVAIQLAVALHPLQQRYGIDKLVISTYQAVSGAGGAALQQLHNERQNKAPTNHAMPLPGPIYDNLLPEIGPIRHGHSEEETKIRDELRKILEQPQLPIHLHCIRVPISRGHGASVYMRCKKACTAKEAEKTLLAASTLSYYKQDNYPTPREVLNDHGVHVGRLRQDATDSHGLLLWVVADNLRKGAASNALQIAAQLQPYLINTT